ncbi:TetR/AcrR family transcriptional regulator [Amycolatopsis alkalitolerans]|uniref:TetR/AcrR family transcriptional regulator n=1 Tax=Amycolatopsis alkalitolerans TaxID=2547244 RepID=A0A5C4LZK9_9PSEU|nr:TetR/AcrR family transcriptional regulator [Amycolatopsis alkalitolerans]TNC25362.1 TetR/AcrR family transcriptional regulator [Amycolatopsis alkalitolerans]
MATRHSDAGPAETHSRERFLQAALNVLVEQGVAGLTVRGLAGAAGSTTIGVYTRFGGRTGVLDALYERTFELLHEQIGRLGPGSGHALPDVLAFGRAYREFALESPARYAFMFERAVPGYVPDPDLRMLAQRDTYDELVARARPAARSAEAAERAGYLVWTTMHGLVSLELTHRARTSPPGWFLGQSDDSYARIFREGLTAIVAGLDTRPTR